MRYLHLTGITGHRIANHISDAPTIDNCVSSPPIDFDEDLIDDHTVFRSFDGNKLVLMEFAEGHRHHGQMFHMDGNKHTGTEYAEYHKLHDYIDLFGNDGKRVRFAVKGQECGKIWHYECAHRKHLEFAPGHVKYGMVCFFVNDEHVCTKFGFEHRLYGEVQYFKNGKHCRTEFEDFVEAHGAIHHYDERGKNICTEYTKDFVCRACNNPKCRQGQINFFSDNREHIKTTFGQGHAKCGEIHFYEHGKHVCTKFAEHHNFHGQIKYIRDGVRYRTEFEEFHDLHGKIKYYENNEHVRTEYTKGNWVDGYRRDCHDCKCDASNITEYFAKGRRYKIEETFPEGEILIFNGDYEQIRMEYAPEHERNGCIQYYKNSLFVREEYSESHKDHGLIRFYDGDRLIRCEYAKYHPKYEQIDYFYDLEMHTKFIQGPNKGSIHFFTHFGPVGGNLYKKQLPNGITEFYEEDELRRIEYDDGITKVYECGQLKRIQYFKGGPWKEWQEVEAEMQRVKEERAKDATKKRMLRLEHAEEQRILKLKKAEAERVQVEEAKRLAAETKATIEAQNLQELKEACMTRKLRNEQQEQERARLQSQKQKEEEVRQKGIREAKSAEKKAARKANNEAKREAKKAAKTALESLKHRKLGIITEYGEDCKGDDTHVAEVQFTTLDVLDDTKTMLDTSSLADIAESSIGGDTTCIVCFAGNKSHIAVPCGHQSICESCAKQLKECPYCRTSVTMWMQIRVV